MRGQCRSCNDALMKTTATHRCLSYRCVEIKFMAPLAISMMPFCLFIAASMPNISFYDFQMEPFELDSYEEWRSHAYGTKSSSSVRSNFRHSNSIDSWSISSMLWVLLRLPCWSTKCKSIKMLDKLYGHRVPLIMLSSFIKARNS